MRDFQEMRLRETFVDADYDKTFDEFLQRLGEQNMDYLNGAQDAINIAFCMASKAMAHSSNDELSESINKMYTMISATFMWQTSQLTSMWREQSGSRRDTSPEKVCDKYCGNRGSVECILCPYGRRRYKNIDNPNYIEDSGSQPEV